MIELQHEEFFVMQLTEILTTYEGNINCNDKYEGYGVYTHKNGDIFKGNYVNGKKQGKGEYSWADGTKFVGEYHQGKESGLGVTYFTNGKKFSGGFRDGYRHGKGTWYFTNGDYSKVHYYFGKRINKEIYYYKDGAIKEYKITNGERSSSRYIVSPTYLKRQKEQEQKRKKAIKEANQKRIRDLERKKEERKKEEDRLYKERLEKIRKENEIANKKRKEQNLKIDRCLLKVYKPEKNWKESDARQLCYLAFKSEKNIIKRNCIIQKGKFKGKSLLNSVENVCDDIANNPSSFDKILYGGAFSKALDFFN